MKARVKPSLLLVTATDGNHGFGVAYLAKLFGCKAKVMIMFNKDMLLLKIMLLLLIMKMPNRS